MPLTKQEIKEKGITKYYILMDGVNDDKIARCTTMKDVKREARAYDEECDGEWEPELFLYDSTKEKGQRTTYIEDWNY